MSESLSPLILTKFKSFLLLEVGWCKKFYSFLATFALYSQIYQLNFHNSGSSFAIMM